MTAKLDHAVDSAADALERFVRSSRREGGLKAKAAEQLESDPEFLRKLKPSLIRARARGENPTVETSTKPAPAPAAAEPAPKRRGGGPSPFVVLGAAFAAGILLAKAIDWRSHAHPRA